MEIPAILKTATTMHGPLPAARRHSVVVTMSLCLLLPLPPVLAGTGILEIDSKPGGAQVYVDGKRKGTTPENGDQKLSLTLPKGDRAIELQLEGYETLRKMVIVGEGTVQTLTLTLTREVFTNSLGMRFVPVEIEGGPSHGESLLFSVWETRVRDFRAFVEASGHDARTGEDGTRMREHWEDPGFIQSRDHPVVRVSWHDAEAFCHWLTDTERRAGRIGPDQSYRLPTDHEWSCAAGIGGRENSSALPYLKSSAIQGVFPWGTEWPPQQPTGNYGGDFNPDGPPADGYNWTSPVGSFPASPSGLHDLGGNVWEWCGDWWDASDRKFGVLRGGSWTDALRESLLSSVRSPIPPVSREGNVGFRCVLGR